MKPAADLVPLNPASCSRPGVSIVIPCRNEVDHIERCLQSVIAQEPPANGFEVIVADGSSVDDTQDVITRFARRDPRVRLIDNPRKIVSAGMNAAIRAASGTIIVRMDAHTEYAPDYVRQCVLILTQTGADNVGGPARTRADGWIGKAVAAAYHSRFAVGGARFHDPNYEGYLDTVTYGCWRRESFDRFGYFDEELVRNQDDEHNLRITRAGGRIYQSPKIQSWYRPRNSLSALFRQYMQYGYWKVRVIQKHKLPASWRHLVPGVFVFALLLLAVCSLVFALGSLPAVAFVSLAALGLSLLAYTVALILASIQTASHSGWKLLSILPFVFACYHFGYGFGFVRGVWDFFIRRKSPSRWSTKLTRDDAMNAPD